MQEVRSRIETKSRKAGLSRPAQLFYSNTTDNNQNHINNQKSVIANLINNNHTDLSRSLDNCWKNSRNKSNSRLHHVEDMVSPTSEEDNSPTEMNNSRKFIDKPPLVKRLTMALLLKTSEDSRPLMCSSQNSNLNNYKALSNKGSCLSINAATTDEGYVNEGVCGLDEIISSKFGDSCRKSLMSINNHQHESMNWSIDHLNNQEFNLKKNLLRETSSGEFD